MSIPSIDLFSGDDKYSFYPDSLSTFKSINDSNELHTFIDVQNPITSVGVGPWLSASDSNVTHCLIAIAYEKNHWNESSVINGDTSINGGFKGGISVYSVSYSPNSSYNRLHDTGFSAKPLEIIWSRCKSLFHATKSGNHAETNLLGCCNMITCLFDNGNLEVFEAVKSSKLVKVFGLTLEMLITSVTTSQISTEEDINNFFVTVSTESNELIIIKLYDKPIDSNNKLSYKEGDFMSFRNNGGLYSSKIAYKTITSNIDYLSTSHVQKMAISSDSKVIAMGSSMGMVTIWDMRFGKSGELANYTVSNKPIYQLLWTKDSKYLLGYSSSLFVIDWLGSHSITHYDVTPYQHQPLCHGLRINSNKCFMVIKNELIVFSLQDLLSHNQFKFIGFEWVFNNNNKSEMKKIVSSDKLGAKDILNHLNYEISLGYARLEENGLKIVRGVKNYRSGKSTKRQKGGKSEFLTFNTNELKLLDHTDFVLSPTCIDAAGNNPEIIAYGGSSGLVHLILNIQN